MIRNEKGFTYPLIYILLLFFITFLSIQMELYLSEKKLLKETEFNLEKEYYFKRAIFDLETLLTDEWDENSGSLSYFDSEVEFTIADLTSEIWIITIHLILPEREKLTGIVYYDKNQKKMIKWYEKNK